MKKVKIKFDNLQIGPLLSYLFLILVSSLLIVIGLISLPLTEQIKEEVSYNLTTKDDLYWSKEYILELDTSQTLDTDKERNIAKTRNIIYRRLNKAGLEEISIYKETLDEKDILRVIVKTSKDEVFVDNLIQNRFFVRVVIKKEDVDFEDEENQYAYLMGENYNPTEFTGSSFRNILLTELKDGSGEYSYFAVFKLWLTNEKAFQNFLKTHEEETIGLEIDGFVTPYYVPTSNPKTFAITVSGGEGQAQMLNLLYNSGEIPLPFTTIEINTIDVEIPALDHIKLSIALLTGILLLYLILLFILKEDPLLTSTSLFATLLTIAMWISYLKLSSTPVDTWLLAIECIMVVILIYLLVHNKESQIAITTSLVLSFFILIILGIGYMKIFGREMLLVLILCQFSIVFTNWYLTNMKKTLAQ